MFCEKCGTKNSSSSKFCEKCGNKLAADEKKTKSNTAKKKSSGNNISDVKNKINSLSKKQKIIGGIVAVVVIALIIAYIVLSKMTSLESMGEKVFKQLADNNTINDKYLAVSLNSDDYFVSLGDTMKEKIKDAKIDFEYDSYTIDASDKKIIVKYKADDDKYRVIFKVKKDGKTFLFFDKYIIKDITVEKNRRDIKIYDPENSEKITVKTVKGSKLTIDGKDVPKKYVNSKKSDKAIDVYVIKGVAAGEYETKFSFGKLAFKKSLYVYTGSDNEFDLTNYISYSYLDDDTTEYTKEFKNYITTYYEYVNDSSKTADDFNKKYKMSDDIKEEFADAKDYYNKPESFKITDVTLRSLYYYSSDDELVVTYKVNYSYKMTDSDYERTNYDTVRVTYKLEDPELPIDLDYMPY